jgi:hypothetical protein
LNRESPKSVSGHIFSKIRTLILAVDPFVGLRWHGSPQFPFYTLDEN